MRRSGWRDGWGVGWIAALGIPLDAPGALPCVEFFGLAFVEVAKDGIEDVDLGVDEGELGVDEGGVFGALLDLGAVMGVDLIEGITVLAQAGDEVRGDGEGEKAGAEGGLGGLLLGGVSTGGGG